jgi:mono/diheme cytochrome c family protein
MSLRTSRRQLSHRRRLQAIFAIAAITAFAASPCAAVADDDNAKIAGGEQVYNTYCATCHGDDLVNSGLTFDLHRLRADERARFENSVLNGKDQMPPWKGVINEQQIDQLWHYIRAHADQR